jgi:hypothetical protein
MGPMLPQRLVLLFLGTAVSLVHSYTAEDSFTWAIKSNVLASEYHQEVYDRFMEECRQDAAKKDGGNVCDQDEKHRMHMNTMQPAAVRYQWANAVVGGARPTVALDAEGKRLYTICPFFDC